MTETAQQRERLRNSIRHPVSAITAVEVDTVARARETIAELRPSEPDRPSAVLELDTRKTSPEALLHAARAAVRDWPPERGVLFVVDRTEPAEMEPTQFWRGMNFLRESWDALPAHIVFFLLPLNYRLLATVADHFADWVPLRFHVLEAQLDAHMRQVAGQSLIGMGITSAAVARERLAQLEPALSEALSKGADPAILSRRFYLPMFEAAVSLGDLRRASALFGHINETDIAQADRPEWWSVATLYHIERFDFERALELTSRLLDYVTRNRDAALEAGVCHLRGYIAQKQRDFAAAQQWYRKSLAISEKLGDEHGAAITYHQLGRIAEEQRDLAAAEQWYRKSLAIEEKLGNEHGAAITYHQLGIIAHEQRDFAAAEQWYRKSLAIEEKLGNEHGAALTYHQLGRLGEEQRDFLVAEQWYRKAMEIRERLGIEHLAATDYHQLGIIAQEQRDFAAAQQWYRKSLAISERLGDEHHAASTYGQLGILAGLQGAYEEAAKWLIRSIKAFAACNDPRGAAQGAHNFAVLHSQADADSRTKLAAMWKEAGLGALPKVGKQVATGKK